MQYWHNEDPWTIGVEIHRRCKLSSWCWSGNTISWNIPNESISCPKQLCQYRRLFQVPKIEFYNSTQFSIVDRDVTNSKNQESTESSFRGNETPNKLKNQLYLCPGLRLNQAQNLSNWFNNSQRDFTTSPHHPSDGSNDSNEPYFANCFV